MNRIRRVFRSLRIRTFLLVFVVGLLPGLIGANVLYANVRERSISSDAASMISQVTLLSDEMLSYDFISHPYQETINMELSAIANVYSGRVMILDEGLTIAKDTYDMYEGRTVIWENAVRSIYGDETSDYDEINHTLTVTVPIQTDEGDVVGVILATKSAEYMEANLEHYRSLMVLYVTITTFAMIFLAFFISSSVTRPLRKIKDGIKNINRGFGDGRLWVSGETETEDISDAFNDYNSQIKILDDSRQEFVSNVSHELKTPLTSMKVLAESITSMGEGAPVEMYREFMGDIINEIDRETKIVNDLLALVKMDKTDAGMNVSPVNVNELIELILKRLKPIAEQQEIELVLESFRPVTVELDEIKFSLAISNLVENGIKYNEPGGYVHVSINSDYRYCYIRVEDSGMGIPEEALDHIFERFYRADKSHSREIGGTGLGLAITQNAIQMHHGEIKVASTLGVGTTFDVRLPLNYIEDSK